MILTTRKSVALEVMHGKLPLLEEVLKGEGALLVHLPLDEVKGVALVQRHHPEEAVLRLGAVRPPVKSHFPLCPGLEQELKNGLKWPVLTLQMT